MSAPLSQRLITVAALGSLALAAGVSANGGGGPPFGWEAHPPIHVRRHASTGPIGLVPRQVRHAYGFDAVVDYSGAPGAGQVIGIVDAYGSPTIQQDLNTFSAQFGIPSTQIQIAYPQGKVRRTDSGWALETALDVEWAHAVAPGARILLVVTKSASLGDLLGGVDYAVSHGAKQVSMSWGGSEFSSEASYDSHFNKPGVTFFASSGDNGSGVEWPAVSPSVSGVGGTSLTLNADNTVASETAWSGSGGGISSYVVEPGYQSAWQSSGKRGVPDVSYNADPYTGVAVYDSTSYQGQTGWFQLGGTSAGAPQWAGLLALANAARAANGRTSLSAGNPVLYSMAPGSYREVAQGDNGGFTAGFGYDYVTGVGSPLADVLIPQLAAY